MMLLLVCLLGGAIVSNHVLFQSFNENWIDAHIRDNGVTGMLLFLGLGATATALGSPRQLLAFFGGYAFGFINGALLSTLAAGFGCILSMYFARFAVREQIKKRYPQKVSAIDRFLAKSPFTKTIVIRLLPIGNNLVTNLVLCDGLFDWLSTTNGHFCFDGQGGNCFIDLESCLKYCVICYFKSVECQAL